ncbi:MAG: hypothetical protein ACYC9R_13050 [Nitrosotalea sp.]
MNDGLKLSSLQEMHAAGSVLIERIPATNGYRWANGGTYYCILNVYEGRFVSSPKEYLQSNRKRLELKRFAVLCDAIYSFDKSKGKEKELRLIRLLAKRLKLKIVIRDATNA